MRFRLPVETRLGEKTEETHTKCRRLRSRILQDTKPPVSSYLQPKVKPIAITITITFAHFGCKCDVDKGPGDDTRTAIVEQLGVDGLRRRSAAKQINMEDKAIYFKSDLSFSKKETLVTHGGAHLLEVLI